MNAEGRIRVVIADDHPVVRDGLRLTLERSGRNITVAAEAANGLEVLRVAAARTADVFILDITMPMMNGIETARELRRRSPTAKIVMLSLHGTKAMVEEALAAGARGYLTKETATRHVVEAVTEVHAGRRYFSPGVAGFVSEVERPRTQRRRLRGALPRALTGQERRVLQLIAESYTGKEIAALLGLASNTVHVHRSSLMAKLDLHRQADLVRYAIRAGLAKL